MTSLDLAAFRLLTSAAAAVLQRWRRVRVEVHRAFFEGQPEQMFFIKVTNLSFKRDVEVVRVWFTTVPTIEVLAQPLPKRLKPDELWETWEPVSSLPDRELPYAECRVRVRLSSGKEVPSKAGRSVAPRGYVAGTSQR